MNIKLIKDDVIRYRPDPKWIMDKNWKCRIYISGYDRVEANFITKAIEYYGNDLVEFYVDDKIVVTGKKKLNTDYINSFRQAQNSNDILVNCAGITNSDCDFLFFKDPENEIYMLFGSENFVFNAMPIELSEYKRYYQELCDEAWYRENTIILLKKIFLDYPKA